MEEKLRIFFNKRKILAIFANYVTLWSNLAFYLTLAINLLILLSYSTVWNDKMDEPRLFLDDNVSKE